MIKKTILIIDDHPLFRKGVRQLLSMVEHYEAADGVTGLIMIESLEPNMVLLDLNMKSMLEQYRRKNNFTARLY